MRTVIGGKEVFSSEKTIKTYIESRKESVMDEIPASYTDFLGEEERRQGRHWLRIVMLAPELTLRILRYIYTQAEPRLSRFVDSLPLDETGERLALRRRFGFADWKPNTEDRRVLRTQMGPGTFSDLASLFRDMPHLEELNLWRRAHDTRRCSVDFEGRELLAAYAADVVDQNPVVNGRGMGIGWGPWPDLREVGVTESGNVRLLEGRTTHYGKQFACSSTLPLETMLGAYAPEEASKLGVWEFCLREEALSTFWIGLHPEAEHRAMLHTYGFRVSMPTPNNMGMGAVLLREDEVDTYAARNQGIAEERDEIARRFAEARVKRNTTPVIQVVRPPLRFVLET